MSLDKKRVIVDIIKEYLVTWIELGRVPNKFMNKNTTNIDEKTVVYTLGSSLYLELTDEVYRGELNNINIKEPRVYQFLQRVLSRDREQRESNPKALLEILEEDNLRDNIEIEKKEEEYQLECFSSVGLTRLRNQDYLGCQQFKDATLLIVADGVGGANGGEIASKITVDFVINSLQKYDLSTVDISETLRDIVFGANQEVLGYTKKYNMGQMGTTLSIALVVNQKKLYIAHVGDSRIYEFNYAKKPRQITQDHSEVEMLYSTESITKEEKKNYKKNILRYAIGLENLKREDIFVQYSYILGDINLLLCSDGLWEKIDIDEHFFNKSFNSLKEDIFNSIPTDNVTFIRYSSIAKIDEFKLTEIPFEEEFIPEENIEKPKLKKSENKFKKQYKQKQKNRKNSLKPKLIEKINKILIAVLLLLSLFIGIYFIINKTSSPQNIDLKLLNKNNVGEINKSIIKPLNNDKNRTTESQKEEAIRVLDEEIDKTLLKLEELKNKRQKLKL